MIGTASADQAPVDHWFSTRSWQAEDGLPENRVVGLTQAQDGYLWVATRVGLVRFDGVRFLPVVLENEPDLFAGTMWGLAPGRNGRIWLAKEGGVLVGIDGDTVQTYTPDDGLPENEAQSSLAEDGEGTLWVAYSTGKVVQLHNEQVKEFPTETGALAGPSVCWLASGEDGKIWFSKNGRVGLFEEDGIKVLCDLKTPVTRITKARGDGVWICDSQGVIALKENGETEHKFFLTEKSGAADVAPTVLLEDKSGAVWVGTESSGLFRCDDAGVVRVETSHPSILSLTEDREGNLWVGTRGGGLDRVRERVTALIQRTTGLPFEGVQSVSQDASGTLWAVGHNGILARREEGRWNVLSPEPNRRIYVKCVTSDTRGTVWIGTRGGMIYRWSQGAFTNLNSSGDLDAQPIQALLISKNGDLWVGTGGSDSLYRMRSGETHLQQFDLPDGYRYVRALAEDTTGTIWAGASDGLLVRVTGNDVHDLTELSGAYSIRCLHAATNGDVWVGYSGFGAGRWRLGEFAHFGQDQGIPNNFVSQIMTDGEGRVWFAGNQGIFQVFEKEFDELLADRVTRVTPAIYGRNEGMAGLQASFDFTPASVHTEDDRMFFSMLTGLAEIRLDRVAENSVIPNVIIERVLADGKTSAVYSGMRLSRASEGETTSEISSSNQTEPELRIPPGAQLVQFEFSALSFVAPERSRFRYQLEGLDADWVEAGTRRFAEYTHPPPGRYRFKVIACNNDGIWNETGDTLSIIFEAYFWETTWFKTGSMALISGGLCLCAVLILRRRHAREVRRLEHQRSLELERTRIARDLHDDLGVGLTEIGLLGDLAGTNSNIPASSQEYLEEITGQARTLAVSLDEIVWAINPANDRSQSLVDYFFPYAQKLLGAASIRCRLEVLEPLPTGTLNAEERHEFFRAYKESLNNVIRHAEASEVRITFSTIDGHLSIRVADNGQGLEYPIGKSHRHGLSGMRERLLGLGGRCEISSSPATGTAVNFIIPIQTET